MKIKQDVASVYIIQNLDLPKRVKIGFSKNVGERMKALRSQSGCEMKLLYKTKPIYNYAEVESDMHRIFDEYRRIGEWFHMNSKYAQARLKDMTSKSETCKIVKHFEDGRNATYIANALNVSRSGVVKYLKSKGYMEPKVGAKKAIKVDDTSKGGRVKMPLSASDIQAMVKASQEKRTRK